VISFLRTVALGLAVVMLVSGCSNSLAGRYKRANDLFEEKDYEKAVEEFLKLARLAPADTIGLAALRKAGDTYYLYLKKYEHALRAYYLYVERSENPVEAFKVQEQIAEIFFLHLEDWQNAIVEYDKLIMNKGFGQVIDRFQFRVAQSYQNLGQFEQSVIEFDEFLTDYPNSELLARAWFESAVSCHQQKKYDDALKRYKKVLEIANGQSIATEAQFGIANVYEDKEDLNTAINMYRELMDLYPNRAVIEMKLKGATKRRRLRKR
jgi:tetratricopeptide (TPR) repeat protein